MVFRMRAEYVRFRNSLLRCQMFNGNQHHKGPKKQKFIFKMASEYLAANGATIIPDVNIRYRKKFLSGLAINYPLSLR